MGCHTGAKYEFDRNSLSNTDYDVRSNDKFESVHLNKENISISADIYRINYMLKLHLKITNLQPEPLNFEYDKIQVVTLITNQVLPLDDSKMLSGGSSIKKDETKEFSYRFDIGKVMESPHFKDNKNIQQLKLIIAGLNKGTNSIPVVIPLKMVINGK